ncbi:MAG TPA: hypothetical protein VFB98_00230 [Candidatus Deferrimicrobium sp.]|nr:hypothetical protein [Candidatus Deferrimicrobium sp.]
MNKTSAWSGIDRKATDKLAAEYMSVMRDAKTEREFVEAATVIAEAGGYRTADALSTKGLPTGRKLIFINRGKMCAVVGAPGRREY